MKFSPQLEKNSTLRLIGTRREALKRPLGFAAAIDAAIGKIAAEPQRFPKTYAGCQRCFVQRYPYCVVFYRDGDKIVIFAFAHSKRRPDYWRHRK